MNHTYKLISNTTQEPKEILDALSKIETRLDAYCFLDLFEDMTLIVEDDKQLDFKDAWIQVLIGSDSTEKTINHMKELFSSLLGEEE